MTETLLVFSAVLTIVGILPYLRDIVRGKTKPRLVSWFNWTLLTGIATAAAIVEQEYPSAVLTGAATTVTTLVVILGFKYGDRSFDRLDIFCQIGAIAGLLLWAIFRDPVFALIITLLVDFIAGIPTLRHAWKKPYEETAVAFMAAAVGAVCAIVAVEDRTLAGLLFPIYILLMNSVISGFILWSPHNKHTQST